MHEAYFGLFLSIILNHVINVHRKKQNLKVVKKILFKRISLNIRFCFDEIQERSLITYALEILLYTITSIIIYITESVYDI